MLGIEGPVGQWCQRVPHRDELVETLSRIVGADLSDVAVGLLPWPIDPWIGVLHRW